MQRITPCIWFNGAAEEAAGFYTSLFEDARILKTVRFGKEGPGEEGSAMTVSFTLEGKDFLALNGDPDREKADRVMAAIMPMKKLNIEAMQKAYGS